MNRLHCFVKNGDAFLEQDEEAVNGVERLESNEKTMRTDEKTGKTTYLFKNIFWRKVGGSLHMVFETPMGHAWTSNRFKESHPTMVPKTEYKISKASLNDDQLFAFKYQGDRYDQKGTFESSFACGIERTKLDESTGYMCGDFIRNRDMGLVDRETGVWVEAKPAAVRKYLAAVGVSAEGEGTAVAPLTTEEAEQVRARVLLQDDGVKFQRVSYGEYMHLCYWGYRKLAGSQVKLPSTVKKQGGQCEFANAFAVVPRSVKPGVAFLKMME